MPVTAQQIFEIAMDLIDERLDSGIISEADTREYRVKAPNILTMGQMELHDIGDLYRTFEISQKPIPNMFGFLNGFEIQEFTGTDLIFTANGQARAYYFEVDSDCTVYIEDYTDRWNTLDTLNLTADGTFRVFKGVITPTSNSTITRLRFTGYYYFKTINRALFSMAFKPDRIPDYKPWLKYELPSDFKSISQIVNEFPQRQYQKDTNYKWEGRKDLYINYDYEGIIRVIYKPIPDIITDMNQELQIDDVTATTILPYYLATHLMIDENSELASYFNGRFMELKTLSKLPKPVSAQAILDVYSKS